MLLSGGVGAGSAYGQNAGSATGDKRFTMEPSPSWPLPLDPQQRTPPAPSNAQEWLIPEVIALTPERISVVPGNERLVVESSPSWPFSLNPQQRTPLVLSSAQE
jgi:hypothetical protein